MSDMRLQFRSAAKEICQPVEQNTDNNKSYAQVAPSVEQQAVERKACGLKPEKSKAFRLAVRLSEYEREYVVRQAEKSCLTMSDYFRASILGPGYAVTIDPMKRQLLQDMLRELNRQGNNLNQIARLLNAGNMTPDHGERELARLTYALIAAQRAVREALAEGKTY